MGAYRASQAGLPASGRPLRLPRSPSKARPPASNGGKCAGVGTGCPINAAQSVQDPGEITLKPYVHPEKTFKTLGVRNARAQAASGFGGGVGGGEHPKVAAVRASARERLARQEEDEARAKEALVKSAAGYLETFYQARAPRGAPDVPYQNKVLHDFARM